MRPETRPDAGYVDPGEGYSSFRDDDYYNTGGGLSLQPSNNTASTNDPFEGMSTLEVASVPDTYYNMGGGLSLQSTNNNVTIGEPFKGMSTLEVPSVPNKYASSTYTIDSADWKKNYDLTPSQQQAITEESNGSITFVNDPKTGSVTVTGGIANLNKFYNEGGYKDSVVGKYKDNGQTDAQITAGASIKGAYIVATTALAGILAQIWMNKQTQDRNDELWQKTADENRAQMMYTRTGSWTGEASSGGGGGGGAGTGPKLTGIKGYV